MVPKTVQAPAEERVRGGAGGDQGLRLSQVPDTGNARGLGLPSQGAGVGADLEHLSHLPLGPGQELVVTAQPSVTALSGQVLTAGPGRLL